MFKKFARGIKDERLRKQMRAKYIAKNIWLIVTIALFICFVIHGIANGENEELSLGASLIMLLFLTMTLVCLITACVLSVKFTKRFQSILTDEPLNEQNELDRAIRRYREEYSLFMADIKKITIFAVIVLVSAIAICVALIIASASMYDVDSELSDVLLTAGVGTFLIGLVCSVLPSFIYGFKKGGSNNWWQTKVADEIRLIDSNICKADGRAYDPPKQKYDVLTDKNAQTLNYLMPTEELRVQAEAKRKKNTSFTCSAIIFFIIVEVALFIIFWDSQKAFIYPLILLGYFVLTVGLSAIINIPLRKLEKKQYEILKSDEKYALNLKLFDMNIDFSKKWDTWFQTVFGLLGSFIIGMTLALALPDTAWWVVSILWLFIALYIRTKQFGKMRTAAKLIEDEIDRLNPKAQEPSGLLENAEVEEDILSNFKKFIKRFEFDYATDEQRKHYFVYGLWAAVSSGHGLQRYFKRIEEVSLKNSEYILETVTAELAIPSEAISLIASAEAAYRCGDEDFNYLEINNKLAAYEREFSEISKTYAELYS